MKDIELTLQNKIIKPFSDVRANILVQYKGGYDGVVVNTQILDSNELVVYKSYNGKKISQNLSRLFISKENMANNKAEFTFDIEFKPKKKHDVKIRVSIIEQHKEVESDALFAQLIP